jgi:hypothetical protein
LKFGIAILKGCWYATAFLFLIGCSTPKKYNYYFSHVSPLEKIAEKGESIANQPIEEPIVIYASTAKVIPVTFKTPAVLPKIIQKKPTMEPVTVVPEKHGRTRRIAAITGVALSTVSAAIGYWVPVVAILAVCGIIICIIGLKSRFKNLAVAGIFLGLIALLLCIIGVNNALGDFGGNLLGGTM